jgi:hypothetical protein
LCPKKASNDWQGEIELQTKAEILHNQQHLGELLVYVLELQ